MPRDLSGNYTLPAGNPVVAGTVISDSGWANPTMSDIAAQLNNVLTSDGLLGATAPIRFADGSAAAPAVSFNTDTALGFYKGVANSFAIAAGGAARFNVFPTGNVSISTPTSGATLLLAGSSEALSFVGAGASINFTNTGAANSRLNYYGTANLELACRTAGGGIKLYCGADVLAATWNSAGNLTLAAPATGIAFTALGSITSTVAQFNDGAMNTVQVQFAPGVARLGVSSSSEVLSLITNNTAKLSLTPDGRVYGSALHNNPGSMTGTTNQYIGSGLYAPVLTAVSNVSALSASICQWMRVGNVVTVSGSLSGTITTTLLGTVIGLSLPIASALGNNAMVGGTAIDVFGSSSSNLGIEADTANTRAILTGRDVSMGSVRFAFSFTYLIV